MSRLARTFKAGRASIPPYYHPNCFFNRLNASDTLAADQSPATNFYIQSQGNQPVVSPAPGLVSPPFQLGFNFTSNSYPIWCVRPSDITHGCVSQRVGLYFTSGGNIFVYGGPSGTLQTYCNNVPIPSSAAMFANCPKITGYTTLSATLSTGGAITSLPIASLPKPLTSGFTIYLWDPGGGHTQTWTLTAAAAQGATSLTVASQTPNFAYPSGSRVDTGDYADMWGGRIRAGNDRQCVIWNLDTDEAWGFWQLYNASPDADDATSAPMWTAEWGEYIPSMSRFMGVFSGVQTNGVNISGDGWGMRACGLGAIGGLITMQDIRDVFNGGGINHALGYACAWTGSGHVAPAVRDDGKLGANPTVEGTRLRFRPDVDLSGITHPMGLAMARAIRDYGMVCADSTAASNGVGGIDFYIEDDRTIGSPYHVQGPHVPDPITDLDWAGKYGAFGAFQTTSADTVLNHMPWDQLQALSPVVS